MFNEGSYINRHTILEIVTMFMLEKKIGKDETWARNAKIKAVEIISD